jgi:drug/metabolite transporter (DMT)-like permease
VAKPVFKDYLHLHFLVVIWGFTAILGLLVSISPLVLTGYRTFLAMIGLAGLLWWQRAWQPISRREIAQLLGVGLLVGLHWLAFFASARVSNASVCLAGMSTTSLWTALLAPLFGKQRPQPVEIGLSLLVAVGLYVIFRFEFNHALGLGLALASAFLAALFTIANSRFVKSQGALVITFYEMMGATAVSWLAALLYFYWVDASQVLLPNATDWLWIVLLAFVCTVYAHSAGIALLKKVTPFMFNLTVNLEPVYGILLAYLVFGERERMTSGFYLGTIIILLAVLSYPFFKSKS